MVGRETLVGLRLHDAEGKPVSRARLQLEAHMSHPGMTPVTADVIEQSAGAYEARVRLADGRRLAVRRRWHARRRQPHHPGQPVPGVRAAATPGGS